MKSIQKGIAIMVATCAPLFATSTQAVQWQDNTAIENVEYIHALRITSGGSEGLGAIDYRECKQCDPMSLNITSQTLAYEKGELVPLAKIKDRLGRFVGLRYEIESKNVVTISWE